MFVCMSLLYVAGLCLEAQEFNTEVKLLTRGFFHGFKWPEASHSLLKVGHIITLSVG